MKVNADKKLLPVYLALALALGTGLLYFPSVNFSFLHMDDPQYVTENELVLRGLTGQGIKSVLTTPFEGYWIPVTWLSLMADSELFGTGPAGFHRTNVILHALNTLLLFAFVYRATGSPWKSFFAASLWTVHPMRVESVAWVTERKDLISGLFFLAGLIAWGEYARTKKAVYYLGALLSMFLGLASKPILVVFPLVLIATDLWPLSRFAGRREEWKGTVAEKLPFFALSAAFSVITMMNQKNALVSTEQIPFLYRLSDVATSYFYYINEAVWPANRLILDRPSAIHLNGFGAFLAWVLIIAITFEAWKKRARYPAVNASWLWYLATLLPVSGIVAVGLNSVADRFSYLPHMGLAILAVWGTDAILGKKEDLRKAGVFILAACLVALTAFSQSYLMQWKDSVTLFTWQAEQGGSAFAERALGDAYSAAGKYEEALAHFRLSVEKNPGEAITYTNMGALYGKMNRHGEAAEALVKSIEINPNNYEGYFNLGVAAQSTGNDDEAISHYRRTIEINPRHWPAMYNAGLIYSDRGDYAEALLFFRKVVELQPFNSGARKELGIALAKNGREAEAVNHFESALSLEPGNPDYTYNLALALFRTGQKGRSAGYFEKTLQLDPSHSGARFNYGLLLEETGKGEEAKNHFAEVLRQYPGNEEALNAFRRVGGNPGR